MLLNEDKKEITIDTSSLGSSLFETMLQEVNDFCSPRRRSNWEGDARQQVTLNILISWHFLFINNYCHVHVLFNSQLVGVCP